MPAFLPAFLLGHTLTQNESMTIFQANIDPSFLSKYLLTRIYKLRK